MEKKYKIEYLPSSVKDLTEIVDYIIIDSPQSAISFVDKIDASISRLEQFPFMGNVPKDIRPQSLGYRMLMIENFLVFYVVFDDIVEIRRIISGKRKYDFLL
ncbi:MAG TPA: type II toxin-antitoxin system RelE/ParE family toxin [Clostridia bacterium]|nr:type II toxin-antitoxin system RelE/ParE family toxin [Clostridia bacterium]